MKKFIILLCVLILIPIYGFAEVKSPTLASVTIITEPEIKFEPIDLIEDWLIISERILTFTGFKDFILLEGVKIYIDQPYDIVKWQLSIPITKEHEPFMLVFNADDILSFELEVTEDGWVITDLTDFDLGIYFLCFYIKKDVK